MKASAAYSDDGKREASCRAPEASHERYNDAAVISASRMASLHER